jgi:hypothetical protein
MLFVLQNSQNRDTKAINIKLDELLRAIEGARNRLVDLKDASDEDLDQLEGSLSDWLGRRARQSKAASRCTRRRPPVAGERGPAFGNPKRAVTPRRRDRRGQRPIKDPPKDQRHAPRGTRPTAARRWRNRPKDNPENGLRAAITPTASPACRSCHACRSDS